MRPEHEKALSELTKMVQKEMDKIEDDVTPVDPEDVKGAAICVYLILMTNESYKVQKKGKQVDFVEFMATAISYVAMIYGAEKGPEIH